MNTTTTRFFLAALCAAVMGFAGARAAFAEDAPAAAPAAEAAATPDAAKAAPKKKKPRKVVASPKSLEARHQICLDFIRRHDRSCDPWQQPTCGYDIGFVRPPECVAP
jgi:hypothetical protein